MYKKSPEVTAFIEKYPKDVKSILDKIRALIHKAAPEAQEAMGYGVPAFKLNGNLVFFAAFKKHIGFYPNGDSAMKKFKKELAEYEQSRGTIRFPLDKPIPYGLITEIVKFRAQEQLQKR
ncbi:MAG: DUF1801 domain-containing protein [Candidatus Goldbacteria bacterium]|nr:DUF1801 domain-containing protein [Candidatus Goldiibacteriota bacterium]